MSSTYIETGSQIRVYDSAVRAHEALPLATYRVHYNPKEGFSLLRVADLAVGTERVYGNREKKVNKIFSSYRQTERSLGVMLSGDKGIGKSMFLRMVTVRALDERIPVVMVTEDAEGIVDFIDTLGECLIVFDEFEKIFPSGRRDSYDGSNRQTQFLSLFDGMSSVKRIYCLTVNEVHDVSQYIVNRPGRFHYHMRFGYPTPDEVRQYLRDQAPDAPEHEIESAVLFARRVRLNYDHLRAIAFELKNPNAQFNEIVEDLNIKAIEPSTYRVVARFTDGTAYADEVAINIFERGQVGRTMELRHGNKSLFVTFHPADLVFEDDGSIFIPPHKMEILDEYEEVPQDLPASVSFTLIDQNSFGFGDI